MEQEIKMEVYRKYRGWKNVAPLLNELKRALEAEKYDLVREILGQIQDIKSKSKSLFGDSSEEYIVARKVLSDATQLLYNTPTLSEEQVEKLLSGEQISE